jgi:hypothetical protein
LEVSVTAELPNGVAEGIEPWVAWQGLFGAHDNCLAE